MFSEQEQFLLQPPAQDTKQPVYQRNQPNIVKPELPAHIKYPPLLCAWSLTLVIATLADILKAGVGGS